MGPLLIEPEDEDEDLTITLLADVFKPRNISIALNFSIAGEYHSIESLVKQYRSIKDLPGASSTKREIISEIRDCITVMENFETIVAESLATTIRGIIAEHPSIEVRNE